MEGHFSTGIFDGAAKFAIDAHAGVERRGKGFPYIIHPMEATAIVATMTNDEELLAAAMLHDVVEDTDTSVEDIQRLFGDRVAYLVANESDIEIAGKSVSDSWRERKEYAINRLKKASREVKMVALGDKLSNMRAIARDIEILGDKVWQEFHVKDPKEHKWYYEGLADSFEELKDTEAYKEFIGLIAKVFQ